eukprot:250661-Amphidinium_carterae.1
MKCRSHVWVLESRHPRDIKDSGVQQVKHSNESEGCGCSQRSLWVEHLSQAQIVIARKHWCQGPSPGRWTANPFIVPREKAVKTSDAHMDRTERKLFRIQ